MAFLDFVGGENGLDDNGDRFGEIKRIRIKNHDSSPLSSPLFLAVIIHTYIHTCPASLSQISAQANNNQQQQQQ